MTKNNVESLNVVLMDERDFSMVIIFYFIAKKFAAKFRERHAEMLKSTNKFVSNVEKITRDNMDVRYKLHVSNINGDVYEYTIIRSGVTTKVNLLEYIYIFVENLT